MLERIPAPPVSNRFYVPSVRPLTPLGLGACYALRCNGPRGLCKVHVPQRENATLNTQPETQWLPFPEQPGVNIVLRRLKTFLRGVRKFRRAILLETLVGRIFEATRLDYGFRLLRPYL